MQKEQVEKQPVKLYGTELVYLLLMSVITTLIGWLGENTTKLIGQGFIDSRFHLLPFIGPYGLIVFAVHLCFGSPDNICFFGHYLFKNPSKKTKVWSNIITLVIMCSFVFLGELTFGNLWDVCFGVQLWNYTGHLCCVTQYTCLESTLGVGTAVYLIFKFIYQPLLHWIQKHVSIKTAKWIICTLGVLILLDEIRLICYMIFTGAAPNYWKLVIFKK